MKPEFIHRLLKQDNYRDFLKKLVDLMSIENAVNFSELSRKAGFTSRSFIKEVISGKKRLSLSSTAKIKKAFMLTSSLGNYFEALVALEEESVNIDQLSYDDRVKQLKKLKRKILNELQTKNLLSHQKKQIFFDKYAPDVYAALGASGNGVTVEQIVQKSGLFETQVVCVLKEFLDMQIVVEKRDRYFVQQGDLDIFDQGSNIAFQSVYLQSTLRLGDEARRAFDRSDRLFLHSVLSISKTKMPELKKKMQQLIVQMLDESQDDDGDSIAHVTLGLY